MGWKENPAEHAKLWVSATTKIITKLPKSDISLAKTLFTYQHGQMFFGVDEESINSMLAAWMMSCFNKENMPLIQWFLQTHSSLLSADEEEVLLAAHESWFGAFKVKSHSDGKLVLIDTVGKEFIVETVQIPALDAGSCIISRIFSKDTGYWFCPGRLIQLEDDRSYNQLASHRRFRDSWNSYLKGFFNYLQKEQKLSERTADGHTENVNLLMFFLEDKVSADSFSKVSKSMLKTDFKKYCARHIMPKPDMDKVYYSLSKFFDYLEWYKKEKNEEVMKWLKARI